MSAVAPFSRIERVVIAVRDAPAAMAAYATLLGREASWHGRQAPGTESAIFDLGGCSLELLAVQDRTSAHPLASGLEAYLQKRPGGVFAVAFASDDLDRTAAMLTAAGLSAGAVSEIETTSSTRAVRRARTFAIAREHARGVNVLAIERTERDSTARSEPRPVSAATVSGVDHIVLFSDDVEGGLRLWRDVFGIRERWRREFPERATVNVGLRIDGVTLELVAPLGGGAGERGERLWGVAYQVQDCEAAVARVRAAGMPVSDVRPGLAPATRVATVKWPDGVPTLLIEHSARRGKAVA